MNIMIIKTCIICHKKFKIKPLRKNTAKYCSYKCMGRGYKGKHFSPKSEFQKGHKVKKIFYPQGKKAFHWKGGKITKSCLTCKRDFKSWKSENKTYCSKKCWYRRNGNIRKWQGYIWTYQPNHRRASKGYVKKSILVAEQCLKRLLTRKEVIHHIDRNRVNDKLNNLYLFPSSKEHMRFHFQSANLDKLGKVQSFNSNSRLKSNLL